MECIKYGCEENENQKEDDDQEENENQEEDENQKECDFCFAWTDSAAKRATPAYARPRQAIPLHACDGYAIMY